MTVLSKIRNRAGLLVAVVGISLLIFIVQAAFESGSSFLGSSQMYVGEVAGDKIRYDEFNTRVQKELDNMRASNPGGIDEQTTDMVATQTWDRMVNDIVMGGEYKALGLAVTDEELVQAMLGDDPHPVMNQFFTDRGTGQLMEQFSDKRTGRLNMVEVRNYVNSFGSPNMPPDAEQNWVSLEKYIRERLLVDKYNNLIKKGLYVPATQAKREFVGDTRKMNIRYVIKRYNTLPDSTVQVSDNDILKYYNEHQNEFKVPETTRRIEYVTFDVAPSTEDITAIRTELEKMAAEFKTSTEDSAFVIRESDTHTFDSNFYTRDQLSPSVDTLFNAPAGTVIGPYQESNAYKVSKLVKTKDLPEAHVRHILVGIAGAPQSASTRTDAEAKALADSIQRVIKAGKAKFTDMVDKYSEDPGKNGPVEGQGKGGDYGYLNAESGFVQSFKDAGLNNPKGAIVVVKSEYGYHIIEVLDKREGKKVQLATISREIRPSEATMNTTYQQASDFAVKYNTGETFDKGVEEMKLTKRVADNVKANDRSIPALASPRELIRWAYEAEPGQVSRVLQLGDKFVVAHMVSEKTKGIAKFELVKEEARTGAIREKKAEKFTADLNAALTGAKSVDDVAKKVNEAAADANQVTFNTFSIPGIGMEPAMLGVASAMKANQLSQPIKGASGVFVLVVTSVEEAPVPQNLTEQKTKIQTGVASRVDYEVFEALKEKAEIVDNRAKFNY